MNIEELIDYFSDHPIPGDTVPYDLDQHEAEIVLNALIEYKENHKL